MVAAAYVPLAPCRDPAIVVRCGRETTIGRSTPGSRPNRCSRDRCRSRHGGVAIHIASMDAGGVIYRSILVDIALIVVLVVEIALRDSGNCDGGEERG